VIEAADLISDYVAGLSFDIFKSSRLVQDSVLYRLMIIGEAVAHVSEAIRRRYPNVEWSDIVAFRNFAVHGYFTLDLTITWNAAINNVPLLRGEIQTILETEYPAEPVPERQTSQAHQYSGSVVLPNLVAHADWSTSPKKRWMAKGVLGNDGRYRLFAPEPVGNTATLFRRLREEVGENGSVLVGFDFPIGLPSAFARRAGIADYPTFLQRLSRGEWPSFFDVARRLDEVGARRPFFPHGDATGLKQADFLAVLGFTKAELYRQCEVASPDRPTAAPLFWTVGGNQVGKAAIAGWRDVLCPAVSDPAFDLAIWPFDGALAELVRPGRVVVAETYPAEYYARLGLDLGRAPSGGRSGKRVQSSRAANAQALLAWSADRGVVLDSPLIEAIKGGFGPSEAAEDQFDAVVGLFGMLNVVLGRQSDGEPPDEQVRLIEGWILGQAG